MHTEHLLFELIRTSFGLQQNLSYTPTVEEWQELYDMADKHAILGVCMAGMESLDERQRPPQEVLLQWIGISQQIEVRNKTINQQCLTLLARLKEDGFRGCILKGQGNAAMYSKLNAQLGLWRQSGDIDVWVEGGFDRVIKYVQRISPTDEVNEQHAHLHIFEDTEVEAHFTPSRIANRIKDRLLQKWYVGQQERQMNHEVPFGDGKLVIPTDDFNLVYQMLHIYRHLFNEGIGLRQLMDYYVLQSVSKLSEDGVSYVKSNVKLFGMEHFAEALMWVMGYVFTLPHEKMLWEPDEKRGAFLLSEIMQMGNFGHEDLRYQLRRDDSHLQRYWQTVKGKMRFVKYFPTEAFWQPIDIFLRFFELRKIKRKNKYNKYYVSI